MLFNYKQQRKRFRCTENTTCWRKMYERGAVHFNTNGRVCGQHVVCINIIEWLPVFIHIISCYIQSDIHQQIRQTETLVITFFFAIFSSILSHPLTYACLACSLASVPFNSNYI
jgi:uncharacterized membrane protein